MSLSDDLDQLQGYAPKPPKRKAAPVDTVRVKNDLSWEKSERPRDMVTRNNDETRARDIQTSRDYDQYPKKDGSSVYDLPLQQAKAWASSSNLDVSMRAQKIAALADTLAKARKGLIPAKP